MAKRSGKAQVVLNGNPVEATPENVAEAKKLAAEMQAKADKKAAAKAKADAKNNESKTGE